jgi:hypothetical protein
MPVDKINYTNADLVSSIETNPNGRCSPGFLQLVVNSGTFDVVIGTTGGHDSANAAPLRTIGGTVLNNVTAAGTWAFGSMPPDVVMVKTSGTFDIDLYIHW